jgi:ribonuclease J
MKDVLFFDSSGKDEYFEKSIRKEHSDVHCIFVKDGKVDHYLDLEGTQITYLPGYLQCVGGDLILSNSNISTLLDGLIVDGDLFLEGSCIRKLPYGLRVSGDVRGGFEITSLSEDIVIDGDLDLFFAPIEKLPENLFVGGDLYLPNSPITHLPKKLHVGGFLDLSHSEIAYLPDPFSACGDVNLAGTRITALPSGLTVGGDLNVGETAIADLPEGLSVGGSIDLRFTKITSLPDNFHVKGDLCLPETMISVLPENLMVDGYLDIIGCPIKNLPDSLRVKKIVRTHEALMDHLNDLKVIMNVSIIVHRGTDTIGGTCIEIITESGRLILDLGKPLMKSGGGELSQQALDKPSTENGILSNVSGLYDGKSDIPILGVLLSHAHPDHYGLLDYVHSSIPIYMSGASKALIEVGNIFYPEELKQPEVVKRCQTFAQDKSFSLGPFNITPYLIDHSAFGACSFQIIANDSWCKHILYTGDLRAHGRKEYTFKQLPKKVGHIDCMLMEGTTMGGKHHVGYDSEEKVEEGFIKEFSKSGATFVIGSGSNVDRIVSLYRACKKTGKTLVIDLYQYYLLSQCKAFSPGLPPHDGDHLRVLFVHSQRNVLIEKGMESVLDEARPRETFIGNIIKHPEKMVLRLSFPMIEKIVSKMDTLTPGKFIYTMWQGYLKKDKQGREMAKFPERFGQEWQQVHTSGHAYLDDLKWLASTIQPSKLIPIHTLQGDDFEKHFENVVRIKNGEALNV